MNEICTVLKGLEKRKILILTHHNADVDAISSAIVLKNFLSERNEVKVATCESVAKQCKKILELVREKILIDPDCGEFDFVIVLDTSSYEQVKKARNLKADMLIDHHENPEIEARYRCIDSEAKSTSAIIFRILKSLGHEFTKTERKLLLCGIVSDTSHLRFATRECFKTIYDLLGRDIEYKEILHLLQMEEDFSDKVATIKAAKRMDVYAFDQLILAISRLGSHEAIAARNLLKLGIDVAVVMTKKEGELRISSRGKEKILSHGLNLGEIFQEIGRFIHGSGGGHDLAGSANGKPLPYETVKREILRIFSRRLKRKGKKIKI